ncbi:Phytoene dehydrogenase-related protein [Ferrithrix thermotolerans DSM 19514]|uniref:Phytoene dehydrogenase-related protein n=1 Tax=Ferrithrix thermotolerans DSM 19514 TaxID=1121881 RepID=A0A1M4VHZ1_9ACTN|nr:NAD(P)/FAD-dependent oxidoreductase [Ferrithrix thermotolerans]SHE68462.1 Phytoene dehydrogenase-related protein [Ferrithrix thermotolerans DSM 19514]
MSQDQCARRSLPDETQVAVVGAGLAGLSCAKVLQNNGVDCVVVEKSSVAGGKVRTDRVEGYVFDKGFQVYLNEYPMGKRMLDYTKLELRPFYKGLYIDSPSGQPRLVSDPLSTNLGFRDLPQLLSPTDIAALVKAFISSYRNGNSSTDAVLSRFSSASRLRRSVAEPFLKAVYLDDELRYPISFTNFLIKVFGRGGASIPALGMDMIPKQFASSLNEQIFLEQEVVQISSDGVTMNSGERIKAQCVVVATDATTARRLIPGSLQQIDYSSVGYMYLRTKERPLGHQAVYVPSVNKGPILTTCVMSDVSIYYAPKDTHLISVSYRPNASPEDVKNQLNRVFGTQTKSWEELQSGTVSASLPKVFGQALQLAKGPLVAKNVVLAGDYLESPSIDGAFASGVRAAKTALTIVTGRGVAGEVKVK